MFGKTKKFEKALAELSAELQPLRDEFRALDRSVAMISL